MDPSLIGKISGGLVVISAIPYAIRTYQKKVTPNIVSWSLWSVIGLALLLTYDSSGANESIWPAIFGFTDPLIITILAIKAGDYHFSFPTRIDQETLRASWMAARETWKRLDRTEQACIIFGTAALVMWLFMRESKYLSQYALYVAIVADACAAIPTIVFLWNNPLEDRPFAWGLFSIGYGLAIFAVTEPIPSNYILPIYMWFGSLCITLPMMVYRVRNKIPVSEWV